MKNILRVWGVLILTVLLSVTFTACGSGGGGGGNNDGGSDNVDNTPPPDTEPPTEPPPDTDESTSLITGYMATKYNQEISAFEDDEKAIDRELAAKGLLNSGHHVDRYIDNFNNHIQIFITSSLDYVNQINQTMLIDKESIKVLFNDYKNIHISYMTTFSPQNHLDLFDSLNLIQYAIDELTTSINNMYSVALYQIDAL